MTLVAKAASKDKENKLHNKSTGAQGIDLGGGAKTYGIVGEDEGGGPQRTKGATRARRRHNASLSNLKCYDNCGLKQVKVRMSTKCDEKSWNLSVKAVELLHFFAQRTATQ